MMRFIRMFPSGKLFCSPRKVAKDGRENTLNQGGKGEIGLFVAGLAGMVNATLTTDWGNQNSWATGLNTSGLLSQSLNSDMEGSN